MEKSDAVWLNGVQVARRFGISSMALWRWMRDPELGFPAPTQIRTRNYWRLIEIEEWERHAAAEAASKRKSV